MGKKVFVIGSVEHADKLDQSEMTGASVIAKREQDKLMITNFECFPERAVAFKFQEMNGRVTIEFQLQNGEFLAIGDSKS